MRLLADENIDSLAVAKLRAAGHDVFYVRETSPSAHDPNLLIQATSERRTLLTYDKDFSELVVRRGLPVPFGVILFRLVDELKGEPRENFIFGATTIREQWPSGIWTIRVRQNKGLTTNETR